MKTTALLCLALLCAPVVFAQESPNPTPPSAPHAPQPPPPGMHPQPPRPFSPRPTRSPADFDAAAPEREPVNYIVTVKWSDAKAGTNFLQVLTTPGSFNLNAIQSSVRIDKNDVPTTVSFKGTVSEINPDKVHVQVFLGRTVPYVTSTYSSGGPGASSSSYSQMSVGLDSRVVVSLGKSVVIQSDQNGEVTLTVKRQEN